MAATHSRRVSDVGHDSMQQYSYAAPPLPAEFALLASRVRATSLPGHVYNVNGEYSIGSLYGHPTFDVSRPCQPASTGMLDAYASPAYFASGIYHPPPVEATVTPSFIHRSPAVSKSGMIVVIDYTPNEGESNIPITVNVELRTGPRVPSYGLGHGLAGTHEHPDMKLRLVIGRTALKTTVKRIPPPHHVGDNDAPDTNHTMRLRLQAFTPTHDEARFPEQRSVPMTIQVMEAKTEVLESFTFGLFTYWGPTTIRPFKVGDSCSPSYLPLAPPLNLKRKRSDASDDSEELLRPVTSVRFDGLEIPGNALLPPRLETKTSLVRLSAASAEARDGNMDAHEAELKWVTSGQYPDPLALDKKWSSAEQEIGRRLIRFKRRQAGNKLFVSCEVIPEEAYVEEDIVISCIRRPETRNCWFTSVDVIYLLERLVGNPFTTEEKNRIRRNLEGFKPTTVSKHKPGFEAFFQRIMDFPPPKPRNIEKDVKVFPWSVLGLALEKIVQKYSVVPSSSSASPPSQDSLSPPSSDQDFRTAATSRSGSGSAYSFPNGNMLSLHLQDDPHFLRELINSSPQPDAVQFVPELEDDVTDILNNNEKLGTFPPATIDGDIAEAWRRRASIASSASTDNYYSDLVGADLRNLPDTATLPIHAFSNPFAGSVNLGDHIEATQAAANGSYGYTTPISASHAAAVMGLNALHLSDDVSLSHSRRSSVGSDLIFSGTQNTIGATYGISSLDQNLSKSNGHVF